MSDLTVLWLGVFLANICIAVNLFIDSLEKRTLRDRLNKAESEIKELQQRWGALMEEETEEEARQYILKLFKERDEDE